MFDCRLKIFIFGVVLFVFKFFLELRGKRSFKNWSYLKEYLLIECGLFLERYVK